jgi:hypothetical protein
MSQMNPVLKRPNPRFVLARSRYRAYSNFQIRYLLPKKQTPWLLVRKRTMRSAQRIPMAVNLRLLDQSRHFFSQGAP